VYYQMERAVEGIREACLALGTPVTGGNVSLYNQYRTAAGYRAIHPTPTIGMVGVLRDVTRRADMAWKRDGDALLLLGEPAAQWGASEALYRLHGREDGAPPALDLEAERRLQQVLRGLIEEGLCDTAHDASEGGLAVALAEMAIAGGRGGRADWGAAAGSGDALLFGEAPARVVVALEGGGAVERAEARCRRAGVPCRTLGTIGGDRLRLTAGGVVVDASVEALRAAYLQPYGEALR